MVRYVEYLVYVFASIHLYACAVFGDVPTYLLTNNTTLVFDACDGMIITAIVHLRREICR